jgi:hypothetical protein
LEPTRTQVCCRFIRCMSSPAQPARRTLDSSDGSLQPGGCRAGRMEDKASSRWQASGRTTSGQVPQQSPRSCKVTGGETWAPSTWTLK